MGFQGELFALDNEGNEIEQPELRTRDENWSVFKVALSSCLNASEYCLDLETTGLNSRLDRITVVSLAVSPVEGCGDHAAYAWAFEVDGDRGVPLYDVVRLLRPLFSDPSKMVYGWNLNFDFQFLLSQGLEIHNRVFDGMLASKLLDETGQLKGLKFTVLDLLGYQMMEFMQVQAFPSLLVEYAIDDTLWCLRVCKECLEPDIVDQGLYKILIDIEGETVKIVSEVEFHGLYMDRQHLIKMATVYEDRLFGVEEDIYTIAGHRFLISNPEQCSQVIFGELKVDSFGCKRNQSGWPSTAEKVLSVIIDRHPIIQKLLEYRRISKVLGTYLRPLTRKWMTESNRVHADFLQLGTTTGRYAVRKPGLQQLPAYPYNGVRKAVCSQPGMALIQADWSQIELRLIAWLSGCQNMLAAFVGDDRVDLHQQTQDRTGCKSRGDAKTLNFGLAYLMQVETLARELGNVPLHVAQRYWDAYHETYPELNNYYATVMSELKGGGYTSNLTGRRRRFHEGLIRRIKWGDKIHREAVNFPVQGGAGDLLKIACIRMRKNLEELRSVDPRWNDFRFVLFVHDEILAECPEGLAQDAANFMRKHMEESIVLPVVLGGSEYSLVLEADICICPYWSISKLDPDEQLIVYRSEEEFDESRAQFYLHDKYLSASKTVRAVLDFAKSQNLFDTSMPTLAEYRSAQKSMSSGATV